MKIDTKIGLTCIVTSIVLLCAIGYISMKAYDHIQAGNEAREKAYVAADAAVAKLKRLSDLQTRLSVCRAYVGVADVAVQAGEGLPQWYPEKMAECAVLVEEINTVTKPE